jgi:hypothetical protein
MPCVCSSRRFWISSARKAAGKPAHFVLPKGWLAYHCPFQLTSKLMADSSICCRPHGSQPGARDRGVNEVTLTKEGRELATALHGARMSCTGTIPSIDPDRRRLPRSAGAPAPEGARRARNNAKRIAGSGDRYGVRKIQQGRLYPLLRAEVEHCRGTGRNNSTTWPYIRSIVLPAAILLPYARQKFKYRAAGSISGGE